MEMFRYLLSAKQNGLCYDLQKNGLCCNFFLFTLCKTVKLHFQGTFIIEGIKSGVKNIGIFFGKLKKF
jgi:hypothetical protein